MRKFAILFGAVCALLCASCAHAQYLGQTSPQTVTQEVLNQVTAAIASPAWDVTKTSCHPATGAACGIQNLGQNFHILTYTSSSATAAFQLRLEGSLDGTNWFPISDDATSQTSGAVYAQGFYPSVRVNLVSYSGSGTITAYYAGTSTGSLPPTGALNQSQTYKKILAVGDTGTGSVKNYLINPPCGNTDGTLFFEYLTGTAVGGSYGIFPGVDAINLFPTAYSIGILANTANVQTFQIPQQAGTFIQVNITAPVASTYSVQYLFNCPAGGSGISSAQVNGLMQPSGPNGTLNSQATAVAGSVVTTLTGSPGTRVALFSVSARCSAGTAGITVTDGGTTIWSSGTAEVGTTTFRFQWSPGLAGGFGNGVVVTLTTCGASNTGTLDVQASQN